MNPDDDDKKLDDEEMAQDLKDLLTKLTTLTSPMKPTMVSAKKRNHVTFV
jgi:hypothetical protein